jgi:hypothetical protein
LRFTPIELYVHLIMSEQNNGQSEPNRSKPRGRFTGKRVKALRPETYRRVMELLAEPREQVPYDHISRSLRVSEHTVKAIEKAESASIAERKQRLLVKSLRIAHKAADRIEDQVGGANITQATVAFGVATEKAQLLSGEVTAKIEHVTPVTSMRLSSDFTTRSLPPSTLSVPKLVTPRPDNWLCQTLKRFPIPGG